MMKQQPKTTHRKPLLSTILNTTGKALEIPFRITLYLISSFYTLFLNCAKHLLGKEKNWDASDNDRIVEQNFSALKKSLPTCKGAVSRLFSSFSGRPPQGKKQAAAHK